MKAKVIGVCLLFCFAGALACFAQDASMGTWKLNEAKSKFSAGTTKNNVVKYEAAGDSVKVTIDGTSGDGKPIHDEWTGKYDGKDYAVTGDAASDMRSYKKVNDRSLDFVVKKGGKTTMAGTITVAADGKSRTVTATGTDSMGMKMTSTAVYDKQ